MHLLDGLGVRMENEQTDEGDTGGEKPVNDSKEDKVDATPAEKVRKDTEELKAENDAYDEQKLRAETNRAEKAIGGRSEAGSEDQKKTQDELDEEAAKEFMKDDA